MKKTNIQHITGNEFIEYCVSAINIAVNQYGADIYYEKGPDQVIDMDAIQSKFLAVPISEAETTLKSLYIDETSAEDPRLLVLTLITNHLNGHTEYDFLQQVDFEAHFTSHFSNPSSTKKRKP